MCRPLVEWMLRKLPDGGMAPERKEWSEEETAAIAADFFASRSAHRSTARTSGALLESVLWFGTGYATGDPLRWSPVTVEMLLADWFPRKVVAEPAYLAKLPDLVRGFIRYCHDRQGIRAALTDGDPRCGRPLRTRIPARHPLGPAARAGGAPGRDVRRARLTTRTTSAPAEIMLEGLDRKVGGRMELQNLDDAPAARRALRVGRHPRRHPSGGPGGAGLL